MSQLNQERRDRDTIREPSLASVEDLLRAGLETGGGPPLGPGFLDDLPIPNTSAKTIGDYELLDVIARGGMGVVYRARQRSLNRVVALKMLLGGAYATDEYRHRFRQEAQMAARLQHPNIIPIYEINEHEGQSYYSMELVDGVDLGRRTTDLAFSPRVAAEHVRTVALAVHYAHSRGVLHRDLKPSNILVGSDRRLRITDFGLARPLGAESGLTLSGAVLGTPGYLPPEQAAARRNEIGPTSDVYSLGAVLYCLLTGRPPFMAATLAQVLQQVLETEPAAPRQMNPEVPVDLETICLKCLEKEPRRRYPTAQCLADDLERWLTGRPILARPIHSFGRFTKWVGRHPVSAGLSAAVIASLLLGLGVSSSQWLRAERARRLAEDSSTRLLLQRVEDHFGAGNARLAVAELAQLLRRQETNRIASERLLNALSHRVFLLPLTSSTTSNRPAVVDDTSPSGEWKATVQDLTTIEVRHFPTGQVVRRLPLAHGKVIRSLRFSADSQFLVSASADGITRVWETRNGNPPVSFTNDSPVYCAEVSPDNSLLVTASPIGKSWIYSLKDGQRVLELTCGGQPLKIARFSPDGELLAIGYGENLIRVLTVGGQPYSEPAWMPGALDDFRFGPDGRSLIVQLLGDSRGQVVYEMSRPSFEREVEPFSPSKSTLLQTFTNRVGKKYSAAVTFVSQSPNGLYLSSGARDRTARVWNAHTLENLIEPLVHEATVNCARFSPDSLRLVTSTAKPTRIRIWDVPTGLPLTDWMESPEPVSDVRFSQDGQSVLADSGWEWRLMVLSSPPPAWLPDLAEALVGLHLTADGSIESVPVARLLEFRKRFVDAKSEAPLWQWARSFLDPTRNAPSQ